MDDLCEARIPDAPERAQITVGVLKNLVAEQEGKLSHLVAALRGSIAAVRAEMNTCRVTDAAAAELDAAATDVRNVLVNACAEVAKALGYIEEARAAVVPPRTAE